jgi:hypothetical protein
MKRRTVLQAGAAGVFMAGEAGITVAKNSSSRADRTGARTVRPHGENCHRAIAP